MGDTPPQALGPEPAVPSEVIRPGEIPPDLPIAQMGTPEGPALIMGVGVKALVREVESFREQARQQAEVNDHTKSCPTCRMNNAIQTIRAATDEIAYAADAWVERDEEVQIERAFLHDEVKNALERKSKKGMRMVLKNALKVIERNHPTRRIVETKPL